MSAHAKPIACEVSIFLGVTDRHALVRHARHHVLEENQHFGKKEQREIVPEGDISAALRVILDPSIAPRGTELYEISCEDTGPIEWREDEDINCQQSFDEGWGIFDGDSGYRLEKDDEQGILKEDADAWRLVTQRASYGSALHIRCLEFLRANAPDEWDDLCEFLGRAPL